MSCSRMSEPDVAKIVANALPPCPMWKAGGVDSNPPSVPFLPLICIRIAADVSPEPSLGAITESAPNSARPLTTTSAGAE